MEQKISLTVDSVIFSEDESGNTIVLLIKRKNNPFKNNWALPGGFLDEGETLEKGALRELEEETGVKLIGLTQLHCFGDPQRDPRGHTVSIAHYAIINHLEYPVKAGSDALELKWFQTKNLPGLAFDHDLIIAKAMSVIDQGN